MTPDQAAHWAQRTARPDDWTDAYLALLRFDPSIRPPETHAQVWVSRAIRHRRIDAYRRAAVRPRCHQLPANLATLDPSFQRVDDLDQWRSHLSTVAGAIRPMLHSATLLASNHSASLALGYAHRSAVARALHAHRLTVLTPPDTL